MSYHPTHSIHENTSAAYDATSDLRTQRRQAVYRVLLAAPRTDRQVMQALGFTDMNACRPRVSELIEQFWVIETGTVQCEVTGRKVRVCKALSEAERGDLLRSLKVQVPVQSGEPVALEVAA